jgi:hypothetical protein
MPDWRKWDELDRLKRLDDSLSELRQEGENIIARFDFAFGMHAIKIYIECWKNYVTDVLFRHYSWIESDNYRVILIVIMIMFMIMILNFMALL